MERRSEYINLGAEIAELRGSFEEYVKGSDKSAEKNNVDHRIVIEKLDNLIKMHYSFKEEINERVLKATDPLEEKLHEHDKRIKPLEDYAKIAAGIVFALAGTTAAVAHTLVKLYNIANP